MQELQSRKDIVITDVDKGAAVVILYVEDYVKEAKGQLSNRENYRKVNYYPTTVNNETIHKVISRFQKENLLSENILEGIKTENPKTLQFHLKPKVHKDGNFLRKINQINFVPYNSYLVSLDVKSLYTNNPNAGGIKSIKTSLEKYSERTASTKLITAFLALILTLNKFIFNCRNYLQIKGCAMGTIFAP